MWKRFWCLLIIVLIILITGCSEISDPELTPELEVVEDEPDLIEETIAAMSLRQKIAGLIIVGLEGTSMNTRIAQMWAEYPFGGVILYERNYVRDDWLKDYIAELRGLSKPEYPLLVCIDEEGGAISRLPGETFPSATELALISEEEAYLVGQAMTDKLIGFGIYVNFAPALLP